MQWNLLLTVRGVSARNVELQRISWVALLAETKALLGKETPRGPTTERHGCQVPREFPYMFCVQNFTYRFKKSFVLPLVEDDPAWTLRSEMRFTFQIN